MRLQLLSILTAPDQTYLEDHCKPTTRYRRRHSDYYAVYALVVHKWLMALVGSCENEDFKNASGSTKQVEALSKYKKLCGNIIKANDYNTGAVQGTISTLRFKTKYKFSFEG